MKLKLWVATEEADDMDLFIGIKKINRQGERYIFLILIILKMDKWQLVGYVYHIEIRY